MAIKRRKIFIGLVVFAVLSQLIPLSRSNPPVTFRIEVPQEVQAILSRSCFDCHSNETAWPWYSWVAPVSWLVVFDVHDGRRHLNFSTWGEYPKEKQEKLRKEIWKTVDEGDMPPFQYLPAHPNARLSEKDKTVVNAWTTAGSGQ